MRHSRYTVTRLLFPALAIAALAAFAFADRPLHSDSVGVASSAAALPVGTWTMNVNGRVRSLTIQRVERDGQLVARMQNTARVVGKWDERAHRIQFKRIIDPNDRGKDQEYTGYLLDDNPEGRTSHHYLAGSFTYDGPASTAQRRIYGWFAQLQR